MITYRELKLGEVIQKGDEYGEDGRWIKFRSAIGHTVDNHWIRYQARRPSPSLTQEDFLECVRVLMALREENKPSYDDVEYAVTILNKHILGE